jgi:hypothetical protein
MDRIYSKGIDVKLPDPVEGVLHEKSANLIAISPVEVDGRSPGCPVAICKVVSKIRKVVTLGPKVVEDYIEDNDELFLVAGIHQPFQALGSAIGVLHSKRVDAIITPVSGSRKLGNRHELNGRDAEVFQLIETCNDSLEGPLWGEETYV